jgi:hypothetical protein
MALAPWSRSRNLVVLLRMVVSNSSVVGTLLQVPGASEW